MTITKRDRLEGGIWGLLVGDALGVPYEFSRPEQLPAVIEMTPPEGFDRAHRGTPPGTYSDDGAQALCLLATLIEREQLDVDDFARRLVNWYSHGYLAVECRVFDVGVQTGVAIRRLMEDVPPLEAGPTDERRNGNGSLMRVLPLALFHTGTDAELVRDADRQSRLTHGHARSRVSCALYCLWARRFLREEPWSDPVAPWQDAVASLRAILPAEGEEREALEFHIRPDEPAEGRGGGYVIDALRSARMIVERHPRFEDAVIEAVRLGDDTDTTAALVGGIAGVREGIASIPSRWIDAMRGREQVDPLVAWLVKLRR
ncbi:MAG: ADP-ribosylglycohydrolase family protein [Sandaracinaceae bacterium]|nr:ADP-ribosylglycohydrolase family protein [Sandaracinaceae bacterium]